MARQRRSSQRWRWVGGLLGLLLACGEAEKEDALTPGPAMRRSADYSAALVELQQAPIENLAALARKRCPDIGDRALAADCIVTAAERLARTDGAAAAQLCTAVPRALEQDECHFQVAEATGDPTHCAEAGRFEEDCRMHAWTRWVTENMGTAPVPGEVEGAVEAALGSLGFAPSDPRPWVPVYRLALGAHVPLDLHRCLAVDNEVLRTHCINAGLGLFHDRLNHARDAGTWPCDGGPLPPETTTIPHPELAAALAARKDLCP